MSSFSEEKRLDKRADDDDLLIGLTRLSDWSRRRKNRQR